MIFIVYIYYVIITEVETYFAFFSFEIAIKFIKI